MLPALTAFLSLLLVKQKFDKMERKETAPENLSRDDIPTFLNHQKAKDITDGDGTFALEVFGEHLSEYLAKIKRTKIKFAECLLHPEEKNPYDKKAVAVWLGAEKIGQLSQSDARSYRKFYGEKSFSVLGIIQGGNIHGSVWLDANFGSGQGPHSVFDKGSVAETFTVKTRSSKKYQKTLARFMDKKEARLVKVSLSYNKKTKCFLVSQGGNILAETLAGERSIQDMLLQAFERWALIEKVGPRWVVRVSPRPA